MSLTVNVGKLKARFNGRIGELKRGVMIKLFSAVIRDTPVGNPEHWNLTDAQKRAIKKAGYTGGSLRGAWRFSVGAPSLEKRVNYADPTDRVTAAIAASVTEADGSVFLANAMPYAGRIEYDRHSRTKAPDGMVRKNVIRFAQLLQEEAAK